MSTYNFETKPATAKSVVLNVGDQTGATLTVEFAAHQDFRVVGTNKSLTASGGQTTLSLSGTEVDTLKDSYYRVKSVKSGVTTYPVSGRIDYSTPTGRIDAEDLNLKNNFARKPKSVASAYAATITPNVDTTDVLNVGTLTGNVTVANPTGTPYDGQSLRLRLAQDATGSRTVTFGNAYAFGTDVTATVPTTANAKFEYNFVYNSVTSKWRAVQLVRGF